MGRLSEEQFIELVQKAERDSFKSPGKYKLQLALFALLGYVVIFSVLFVLIVLVGGTVGIALLSSSIFILLLKKKLIFMILAAIWVFLKALWVKFEPPTGYRLERNSYPALFSEIDQLTRSLKSLKIHQVLVTDELNAAVVQSPKYGILGGQQNTLILGLPLLLALSPTEMRAVLAHEFGHLSGNHSRFSGWIYRVRITWSRIMNSYENTDSFGASMMRSFFDWYAPKFSAYSFALARNNEYEADDISAELTSPETAAKALVNVYVSAPYIEQDYWSKLIKSADDSASPPKTPFKDLANFLKHSPIARDEFVKRIEKELEVKTHYSDTHPSLNDRVRSLTSEFVIPEPVKRNAAEVWLGERSQAVLTHFDKKWYEDNREGWKNRYDYVQNARASIVGFKSKQPDELTDDELWEYASYTNEFEDAEAAYSLFSLYQKRHPDSIGAAYYVGKYLLDNNRPEGLSQLRVAFKSPNLLTEVVNLGYNFLIEQGEQDKAEKWWQDAADAYKFHQEVYEERENISIDDHFKWPEIHDETLAQLKKRLKSQKNVGSVWLAEKVLKLDTSVPVYIIAFSPKGIFTRTDNAAQKLANALNLDFPIFVVCLKGDSKEFGKKIKAIGKRIL